MIRCNYGNLPRDAAEVARAAATRMNSRLKRTFLETGVDLLEVKKHLDHGQFTRWLEPEFAMSVRTAERFMMAAELIAKIGKMSLLPARMLRAIACAPKIARDAMVERVQNDDPVTAEDVRRAVETARVGAMTVLTEAGGPRVINPRVRAIGAKPQVVTLTITGPKRSPRSFIPNVRIGRHHNIFRGVCQSERPGIRLRRARAPGGRIGTRMAGGLSLPYRGGCMRMMCRDMTDASHGVDPAMMPSEGHIRRDRSNSGCPSRSH